MNHGGSEWDLDGGAGPSDYYTGQDQQRDSYLAQPSWTSDYELDAEQEYDSISGGGPSYSQQWAPQMPIERPASRYSIRSEIGSHTYSSSKAEEYSCQTCGMTFRRRSDRDRHYQTVHVDDGERNYRCELEDCPAGVTSWRKPEGLKTHNKTWHSYPCEEPGCPRGYPRGFQSEEALEAHGEAAHGDGAQYQAESQPTFNWTSSTSYDRPHESTYGSSSSQENAPEDRISGRSMDNNSDKLDPRYKIQPSSFFVPGRVFKLVWVEPTTFDEQNDYDKEKYKVAHGQYVYAKVRRFVVIRAFPGHSQCLQISTYGGRGVSKRGIDAESHAKIFSSKHPPPASLAGLETGLRKPIRIRPESQAENLDPMSLLNYAKLYTVEHNIKVLSVGRVTKTDERTLVADFDDIHKPLAETWRRPPSSQQSQARVGYRQPSLPQVQADEYNVDSIATGLESVSVSQASSNYSPSFQSSSSSSYAQGSQTYDNGGYYANDNNEAIPVAEVPRRPKTSHERRQRRDRRR